jgi:putative spermidine/putrescine transport system permease protein
MSTAPTVARTAKRNGALAPGERAMSTMPSTWIVWIGVACFFVLLFGVLFGVVVDSFGKPWFNTWLPENFTTDWYTGAWERFELAGVIGVTLLVAGIVVVVSILVGVPASYQLARRRFPFKNVVNGLFLFPILMPPITYGIPLATVMYNMGLGRSIIAVILVNLVPSVPFVIMTMTPFIEQINPTIESAARMCGATTKVIFTRILGPLLVPGILASAVLVLVRTVGMFELTYLVSGPQSDTLVVAIYRAMTASGGGEARQLVSAMAVMYTATMMIILVIALRFVNPTQLVGRVKELKEDD